MKKWRGGETEEDEDMIEWNGSPHGAFFVAQELAEKVGVSLTVPRCAARQTARNNVPSDSPSTYYRRALWYPYLDAIVMSLREKFSKHQLTILHLVALVPSMIHKFEWADVVDSYSIYSSELASEEEVKNEFGQWKQLCLQLSMENRPATLLDALDIVPDRLRNIKILLSIFATLPVSTCTPERSFSALKIVKNFLRNRMTDERLTGLALMYIHPEIEIDITTVIDRFISSSGKRRTLPS